MASARKSWWPAWLTWNTNAPAAAAPSTPKPKQEHPKSSTHTAIAALAANEAPAQTAQDPADLVPLELEKLAALKTTAIDHQAKWEQEKATVIAAGAIEPPRPTDTNHEEKLGIFGAIIAAVKNYCMPAQSYIHQELEQTIGKHIADLNKMLEDQMQSYKTAHNEQSLQIKLTICNTMIDMNIELQRLSDRITSELQSCLKMANQMNMAYFLAWTLLVQSILKVPFAAPDLDIVNKYTVGLGDRIEGEVVNMQSFTAGIVGNEQRAFAIVDAPVQTPPGTPDDLPSNKVSLAQQSLLARPVSTIKSDEATPQQAPAAARP